MQRWKNSSEKLNNFLAPCSPCVLKLHLDDSWPLQKTLLNYASSVRSSVDEILFRFLEKLKNSIEFYKLSQYSPTNVHNNFYFHNICCEMGPMEKNISLYSVQYLIYLPLSQSRRKCVYGFSRIEYETKKGFDAISVKLQTFSFYELTEKITKRKESRLYKDILLSTSLTYLRNSLLNTKAFQGSKQYFYKAFSKYFVTFFSLNEWHSN